MTDNVTQLRPMKVLRTFSTYLGDGFFATFEQGTTIRDMRVVEQLLQTGCKAYLASEDDAEKLAVCPRCHHILLVDEAAIDVQTAMEPIALQIDRQYFTCRKGDLLRHVHIIEAARKAGYDLQDGRALLCSHCQELF